MVSSSFKSKFNSRSNYVSKTESGTSAGFWILAIVLIVLIIVAIMSGTIYKQYERFTNTNANIYVKSYTLQYYCMERCVHCKNFEDSIWSDFSKKINNNPGNYHFDTIKYDITDNAKGSELGTKYNINSTPTIFLFNKETGSVYIFDDDRTEAKLLQFANNIIKSDHYDWKF